MASSSETARAYFAALSDHDLDAAAALWRPGGIDRIHGQAVLSAPEDLRGYFGNLFSAFPDWRFEIVETTTQRGRCVVRWRTRATFAGPGRLQGLLANGRQLDIEGCQVLSIDGGQIVESHTYLDGADVLRQLGVLPAQGSTAQRSRAAVANARRLGRPAGAARIIAPGVWLVSHGLPASMNVYLLAEPGGGVTVFDGGVRGMAPMITAAAARLGGIRRIVLGHADCDHRGGVAGIDAPVYVHPLELDAARSPDHQRPYWDLGKLAPYARPIYPVLFRSWDGGALEVAGTVTEGEEIAGFRVIALPGHAPGLIGLHREEDGLALCSDTVYTLNVETSVPGGPRIPHAAFNWDSDAARDSVLRLAGLKPRVVWAGHSRPVAGPDVPDQLLAAARA